jgi:hypothetical protein
LTPEVIPLNRQLDASQSRCRHLRGEKSILHLTGTELRIISCAVCCADAVLLEVRRRWSEKRWVGERGRVADGAVEWSQLAINELAVCLTQAVHLSLVQNGSYSGRSPPREVGLPAAGRAVGETNRYEPTSTSSDCSVTLKVVGVGRHRRQGSEEERMINTSLP